MNSMRWYWDGAIISGSARSAKPTAQWMTFEDGLLFEPTAWACSDDLSKQKEFDSAVGRCHTRTAENTSLLPAEAHTARCTTGTVGSTGAAEENGIVLFPGIGGGTCPKQQ
jgi:hypothetical protein